MNNKNMATIREEDVPKHIRKILISNRMAYFTDLEKEEQVKYLHFAIMFTKKHLEHEKRYLKDYKGSIILNESAQEEQEFLDDLYDLNIDFMFEKRYGITNRIESAVNGDTKQLMQDIQDDYLVCEFLTQEELLDGEPTVDDSKYGKGLARFASIILSRERVKASRYGDVKKLELIDSCKKSLQSKMKSLKNTFAHEDRELEKLLIQNLDEEENYLRILNEIRIEKGDSELIHSNQDNVLSANANTKEKHKVESDEYEGYSG